MPSIVDDIETVRLYAFAPPGSRLDQHIVAVLPRAMNNPS